MHGSDHDAAHRGTSPPRLPPRKRRVHSGGVELAVREYGEAASDGPTVVLVHGFPDDQRMWTAVVDRLGADLHVVTYDVRGAGQSGFPRDVAGYRTELLVDDLVAVADAVLPVGARFHLVGHDWGSVQLWDAVAAEATDPRLHGRVASFTSVSGPSLDHLAYLLRNTDGRRLRLLRQLVHSWYVYGFLVPGLPELSWRHGHRVWARLMSSSERGAATDLWDERLGSNGAHGVNLYRANVRRRMRSPRELRVDVPVLVVAPRHDRFLTAVTTEDLDRACRDVRILRPDTGHWLPRTHPDLLARLVREHVCAHP
jgi:pimeloyl-ACP methyl ester carboxylesterase